MAAGGRGASFAAAMPAVVATRSIMQLMIGGLLGPLAAWLCCIGFWHVRAHLLDADGAIGRVFFAVATMSMVALGGVHLLWTSRGLAMKLCAASDATCAPLAQALRSYWLLAWNVGAFPAYGLAGLLAWLVATRRTSFPRWTLLANPLLLQGALLVLPPVPAPLGAIWAGGATNLMLTVFFVVSVLSTWRAGEDAHGR